MNYDKTGGKEFISDRVIYKIVIHAESQSNWQQGIGIISYQLAPGGSHPQSTGGRNFCINKGTPPQTEKSEPKKTAPPID